jgi:hypothetical protein
MNQQSTRAPWPNDRARFAQLVLIADHYLYPNYRRVRP